MARIAPIVPLKLAFLVEGDAEKAFLEALVPRVLGPQVALRVVRIGMKSAFPSTYFDALRLLDAGYAAVFLLVNANTAVVNKIDRQKRELTEVFRRYRLAQYVQIHMVVPMLEAWLLAAYQAHPEQSTRPERDLAHHAGPDADSKIGELAAVLPLDLARRRSPSLRKFITALEALASEDAPARRRAARLRAALVGVQPADRAIVDPARVGLGDPPGGEIGA